MFRNRSIKTIILICVICLILVSSGTITATSVNRVSLCNLEGYPGNNTKTTITLTSNEASPRSGSWDVYYKTTDGDNEKMDISSWITIDPKEYTLQAQESKTFIVTVKIPGNTLPGLWGATSPEAGQTGHSSERRTYIVFRDTVAGGNVYSGLLIPISVQVLGKANPLVVFGNFLRKNLLITVLVVIIVGLLVLLTRPKRVK